MKGLAFFVPIFLGLTACTTTNVSRIDAANNQIGTVCIEENPKVVVNDFVSVVEDGFARHGIKTRLFRSPPPDCEYVLTYTARQKWDLAMYMSFAELRIERDRETIGKATYSHSGGFGFNKWASTASKMNPIIDQLLADFQQ